MIGVYIVGEDDVTRHVIYRILSYCGAGRFTVLMELPARGGEIKNKIPNFNQLAMKFPVILLTDLDADNCAPELKRKLLGGLEQAENLVFNVAVDEAEACLMADRDGFAKYISVPLGTLKKWEQNRVNIQKKAFKKLLQLKNVQSDASKAFRAV